jgi:hypothetical protein
MRCALDRLGQSMFSTVTAPRLEFRQALRAELVAQAALQAAAIRAPRRPPKVRKPKGGFRLAALGIGISAAGGSFALAATSVDTPELPQPPATRSTAAGVDHQHPSAATRVSGLAPGRTEDALLASPRPSAGVAPLARTGAPTSVGAPAAVVSAVPAPVKGSPLASAHAVPSTSISAASVAIPDPLRSPQALPAAPVASVAPSGQPAGNPFRPRAGAHWTWPSLPMRQLP